MKDRFAPIASLVILATLVIGTWFAAEYTRRAIELDAPAQHSNDPDSWGQGLVMIRSNADGVAISRIEGDYMEHFPADGSYDVVDPRAMSVQPGQPTLMGTAHFAKVLDDGNRIIMQNDAVLLRLATDKTEPLTVSSQEITLLLEQDVAFTDLPALAIRDRSTLKGVGMRYDNKTGELKVFESTDVEIAPRARPSPAHETEKRSND